MHKNSRLVSLHLDPTDHEALETIARKKRYTVPSFILTLIDAALIAEGITPAPISPPTNRQGRPPKAAEPAPPPELSQVLQFINDPTWITIHPPTAKHIQANSESLLDAYLAWCAALSLTPRHTESRFFLRALFADIPALRFRKRPVRDATTRERHGSTLIGIEIRTPLT